MTNLTRRSAPSNLGAHEARAPGPLFGARVRTPRARAGGLVAAMTAMTAMMTLIAAPAHATPTFPRALARHLGAEQTVPCATCHEGPTRKGTVTTPVGAALRARGLVAHDETSLVKALDTARADQQDSDGDGALDVDELRAGTSPNVAEAGAGQAGAADGTGCHLGASPGALGPRSDARGLLVLALLVACVAARRARVAHG